MRESFGLWVRLAVAAALAALAGYVTSLIRASVPPPFRMVGTISWLVVMMTAIAVALAAQVGVELRARLSPTSRALRLFVTTTLALAVPYGAIVMLLVRARPGMAELQSVTLFLIPGIVSALIAGMLLGPQLAVKRPLDAWVIGLLAPLILALDGAAITLGMGVVAALTYTPTPCTACVSLLAKGTCSYSCCPSASSSAPGPAASSG